MIMADVFRVLFLILGTMITIVGYWLFFEAVAPRTVERSRQLYDGRVWRLLFVGLLIAIPGLIVSIALLNAGAAPVKFIGFTLLFSLILIGLLGSTGMAKHIGTRLESTADRAQPWRSVLRGGTILTITFVLPGIGWFMLLPFTLITGVGAVALSRRAQHEDASELPLAAA
jgi:hypothetical protein